MLGFAPAPEASVEAVPVEAAPAEVPAMPEQAVAEVADDMVASANGKRSLGFFAH